MSTRCRREGGFTLVEVAVVVVIIGIIIALGIPAWTGFRARSHNTQVQSDITNGAKVEAAYGADGAGFTADPAQLAMVEPSLDFSGSHEESLHVAVRDVAVTGDNADVLIYARSKSGAWYGLRLVQKGSEAGRYTCEGDVEGDVDDFSDCTGNDW